MGHFMDTLSENEGLSTKTWLFMDKYKYMTNISKHIGELTSESVQLLKEMIAIPSPSFNEDAVCSHISSWMAERGIAHERIGNNIIAESIVDSSRPTLMLCAHIDTVSPTEEYTFDPYNPDYKAAAEAISHIHGASLSSEDIVAGLGSNDDGASVVTMLAAYRHMYSKANIILVLSCEEERSGKGGMTGLWGRRICARKDALEGCQHEGCTLVDFAIVGEPTGMKAAIAERGLLVIDAVAEGVSGHAARNEGVNAIYIALEDIQTLRNHIFGKVSARMGKININVTQINAGSAHNVIPDKCSFVIDIRPTEQYTNQEILDELQAICQSRLAPRNLLNQSSATFKDSPLQKMAEELGIETFSSPTTSDWMRINCDAIKMGPGDSARSHKKDEYVTVDEIFNGIKTYIEFISKL